MNDMDRLRLYRAQLVWSGRWTLEKDGCGPDYDHIEMTSWKSP